MNSDVIDIFQSADPEADFARAAQVLKSGGLVVLPTETVYGVAGRIDHAEARSRLRKLRESNESAPWTLHLGDPEQAWDYVTPSNDWARRVVKKLWPGPVGLVFDVPAEQRKMIAAKLGVEEAELFDGETITLRCPDHPAFQEVARHVNSPLALTRLAGIASEIPGNFELNKSDVDLVIDAGPTRFSKPSTLIRVKSDSYEIVRAGVFDERIIERHLRTTVLFVCSGNTCRSPMAEALTRKILAQSVGVSESELESRGYNVISAGVYAMQGTRATPQAVEAVKLLGGDLSRHRSQPLTPELLHQADVVYVMGTAHAQAVQMISHASVDKVRMLDATGDVEDPIGYNLETYQTLARAMEDLIKARLKEDKIIS